MTVGEWHATPPQAGTLAWVYPKQYPEERDIRPGQSEETNKKKKYIRNIFEKGPMLVSLEWVDNWQGRKACVINYLDSFVGPFPLEANELWWWPVNQPWVPGEED